MTNFCDIDVIFLPRKITFFLLRCLFLLVAITQYKHLTHADIVHYQLVMPYIDYLIVRTPMTSTELIAWIQLAITYGISRSKIAIHSDIYVLEQCGLSAIHFSERAREIQTIKKKFPNVVVSMSTHNVDSAQFALQHHVDYILFGHIFPTSSKPGQIPRKNKEIQAVLALPIPVVALGGINENTAQQLSTEFYGISGINLFLEASQLTLKTLSEVWRNHV